MLIAKLSTGEMAYYDVWHGGFTKNPWNLLEGASGSSAGRLLHGMFASGYPLSPNLLKPWLALSRPFQVHWPRCAAPAAAACWTVAHRRIACLACGI